MSHLALLTVRNEGAFLLEWIAHHRAVGFDDFLVFSNDCDDGTDAILDRLAAMGWLSHMRNPGPYDNGGIQFTATKLAAKTDQLRAADWVMALDIDEFVNIHVGDGTLTALHAALPEATAITLTWRLFGNNGEVRYRDHPVTECFPKAAPAVMYWPWRASMFKTLYKNDGTYAKPGIHRPRAPNADRLEHAYWYDGHGRALDEGYKTQRIFSSFGRENYGLAQLNHYPLGAMESYLLKVDRGRAVHSSDMLGMDYWVERNFSAETDTTIRKYDAARNAHLATLRADPELAQLHAAAVAWRHARVRTLLEQEPYRALFGRLLMTPASHPLPQKAAAHLISHAARANALAKDGGGQSGGAQGSGAQGSGVRGNGAQ